MNLFFSYPHDANSALVQRLKGDLEARGHTVWFDGEKINSGDEWRRRITEGILNSDGAVAFLSKHSVRDPGVCLNEIAIALAEKGDEALVTVLVEPEKEVSAPVTVSHIQWLNMADWQDHADDDGWYRTRVDQLIDVIEHPASAHRNAELEFLRNALDPLRFNADMAPHLLRYTGRRCLQSRYKKWLADPKGSRVFRIEGGPGMGKTAIASHLAHAAKSSVLVVFLCDYRRSETRNSLRFIQTLAYQLATRLPDYRARLLRAPIIARTDGKTRISTEGLSDADLWSALLAEPMAGVGKDGLIGRQAMTLVVDGLDEATEGGRNDIVRLLAEKHSSLPPWVRVVLTGRPDPEIRQRLRAYQPLVLAADDPHNLADLRRYIKPWLKERVAAGKLPAWQQSAVTQALLDKCEGAFLYLVLVREEVEAGSLDLSRLESLPNGLDAIYLRNFERRFPDTDSGSPWATLAKPLLALVMASPEPLPLGLARELLAWNTAEDGEEREATALRSLGSLLVQRSGASSHPVSSNTADSTLSLFHKSSREWLADPERAGEYFVSTRNALPKLTEVVWRDYPQGEPADGYAWLVLPELLPQMHRQQPQALERILGEPSEQTSDRLFRLADSLEPKLRYAEAAGMFALQVAYARRLAEAAPENADFQRDLSVGLERLGNTERYLCHNESALKHYQDSHAIAQRLAEAAPENAGFQRDLSVTLDRLGDLERVLGKRDAALRHYQDSFDIRQRLAGSVVHGTEFLRGISISLNKLGDIERELGQTEAALQHYQEDYVIARALTEAHPENMEFQRDLSVSLVRLGDLERSFHFNQVRLGDLKRAISHWGAALQYYQESYDITQRLAEAAPEKADFQSALCVSLERLGNIELDLGDTDHALQYYQESHAIRQRLADAAPANAGFQRALGVSLNKLGNIKRELGQRDAALQYYQESHAIRQRMAEAAPENAEFQHDLGVSFALIAEASQPEQARAWWQRCHMQFQKMQANGILAASDLPTLEYAAAMVADPQPSGT